MAIALFSGNGNYQIDVDAALVPGSQNIAANTSDVYWRVIVRKTAGTGFWSAASPTNRGYARFTGTGGYTEVWNVAGFAYDFRNGSNSGEWLFAQGVRTITHNADGTASFEFASEMTLVSLGTAVASTGSIALPRIPRGPRVRSGGSWRNSVAYVRSGGQWKVAVPYVRSGGSWKVAGG